MLDVITNVIGSVLGVIAAVLFEKNRRTLPRRSSQVPIDQAPRSCWFSLLGRMARFPFFPALSQHALCLRLSVFCLLRFLARFFCVGGCCLVHPGLAVNRRGNSAAGCICSAARFW